MKQNIEHIWTVVLTWKVGEIVVGLLDILPNIALFISFSLSTIVSILVIRYYKDKKKVSELECKKLQLEIKNEQLLLRKKDELNLND